MFKESLFNTLIEVRVTDLNYGNHLGHDSLISFFHEARVRFLNKMGYTELDIEGIGILVTNLIVNYKNEAFYSDNILIHIGLGCVKRTGVELIYHAINQETKKEIATALTTITFYNYKKAKVSRIPQQFLKSIRAC